MLAVPGSGVFYIPNHNQEIYFDGRIIGIANDEITFGGHRYGIEQCISKVCTSIEVGNTLLNNDYDLTKLNPRTIAKKSELTKENFNGVVFNLLNFSRIEGKVVGPKSAER